LAYVIREIVAVGGIAPPLLNHFPHSDEHGWVEAELVARASHTHALFRDDNSSVYYKLEEATRTTSYAASIKPFQRLKNGRAAWLALTSQYAGKDKWEQELKKQDDLLHTREWKGQSNFTLERFVQQHRNAFVSMQQCALYVQYQLPTEFTRVGYLLEGIQCNDPGLQAAMASVQTSTLPTGLRNDFEATATHLLPYDPVAKKRNSTSSKRGAAEISDVSGNVSSFGVKEGIGASGVHLRYHELPEYKTLNKDQRDELREWRDVQKKKGKGKGRHVGKGKDNDVKRYKSDKAMAAAIEKQVDKKLAAVIKATEAGPAASDGPTDDEARAYIMSLLKDKPEISSTDTKKVTLKSILRKAKNE